MKILLFFFLILCDFEITQMSGFFCNFENTKIYKICNLVTSQKEQFPTNLHQALPEIKFYLFLCLVLKFGQNL